MSHQGVEVRTSGLGIWCLPQRPAHSIRSFSNPVPLTGSEAHALSWTLTKAVYEVSRIPFSPHSPASPPHSSHSCQQTLGLHTFRGWVPSPGVRAFSLLPHPLRTPQKCLTTLHTPWSFFFINFSLPDDEKFRLAVENVDNVGKFNHC